MAKNKENFVCLSKPDFIQPIRGDYSVKVWQIRKDALAADDFVVKLPLKGNLMWTYAERIFGDEGKRLRIFLKRLPEIKEGLLYSLLKAHAIKVKSPK